MDEFGLKIKAMQERLTRLRKPAGKDDARAEPLLQRTVDELMTAAEELRRKNEELVETRRETKAERRRYHDLFEQAPDGYVVTDPDGTIQEVNRAAVALFGCRAELVCGKPFVTFVAREDRRAFRLEKERLAKIEGVTEWQVHVTPRAGPPFPANVSVAVVRDAGGEVTSLRWLLRDESERVALEEARQQALDQARAARDELEERVRRRTGDLEKTVDALQSEVELRQARERALAASEQRFRDLAEMLPEVVFEADPDGRLIFVNRAGLAMSGYSRRDVEAGLKMDDVIAEEDRPRAYVDLARVLVGETVPGNELHLRRKDGSTFPVLVHTARIRQDGHTTGVRGIAVDIARQKKTERALRTSKGLLERIFASTHQCLVLLDPAFNFIRVNESYARACGRPPEFFPGKNHFDLYPDEEVEAIFRRVVETGEPYTVYARPFVFPDDPNASVTYWDWRLDPVMYVEGRAVEELVFSMLDVTDRVEAEQEAEAERRRLFDVLNELPGFVYLRDRQYRLRFVNRRFVETFGPGDGVPCHKLLQGQAEPCKECCVEEIFEGGESTTRELTLVNGRTYEVHDYPFEGEDGEPLVLRFGLDVTDRKRLEREVSNIATREQRRIGQDLHDSLGQQLTGVAFLAKVTADRLGCRDAPETEDVAEVADLINDAIGQTRALARGLQPVDLTAEGLMTALKELVRYVGDYFEKACRLQCPVPVLIQDNHVATNLYYIAREAVHNAVKHAEAENITVRLDETDGRVRLRIRDDGVGLPRKGEGHAGMGLDVMRYRAGVIGGTLNIRGRSGKGTTVTCVLPREAADRIGSTQKP